MCTQEIRRLMRIYQKECERAFWRKAYELAKDFDLIPINKGVYELREKRRR